MTVLTSKQRAHLRALANGLETILYIGKEGVGEQVSRQADGALTARELIKGKVQENAPLTAREAAETLAAALSAQVAQVIGGRFVLYRPNPALPVERRVILP